MRHLVYVGVAVAVLKAEKNGKWSYADYKCQMNISGRIIQDAIRWVVPSLQPLLNRVECAIGICY